MAVKLMYLFYDVEIKWMCDGTLQIKSPTLFDVQCEILLTSPGEPILHLYPDASWIVTS